jgi:hypothetical protein
MADFENERGNTYGVSQFTNWFVFICIIGSICVALSLEADEHELKSKPNNTETPYAN